MSFLNRLLHRPQKWGALIFTGLVVSSALYLVFQPLPPKPIEKKSPEEIAEVEKWSKEKLHAYLSRHQVYPDIETSQRDLVRLVKSIMNLYPDMDAL